MPACLTLYCAEKIARHRADQKVQCHLKGAHIRVLWNFIAPSRPAISYLYTRVKFSTKSIPHYLIFWDCEFYGRRERQMGNQDLLVIGILVAIAGSLFAIYKIRKLEEKHGIV
jgi:hypothetical protein